MLMPRLESFCRRRRSRGLKAAYREDDKNIAGRSPLRLATFSLPTHREVVAAASRISALGAPHPQEAPGSRASHAACLHSTPPRLRESINTHQYSHKPRMAAKIHCTQSNRFLFSAPSRNARQQRNRQRRENCCRLNSSTNR